MTTSLRPTAPKPWERSWSSTPGRRGPERPGSRPWPRARWPKSSDSPPPSSRSPATTTPSSTSQVSRSTWSSWWWGPNRPTDHRTGRRAHGRFRPRWPPPTVRSGSMCWPSGPAPVSAPWPRVSSKEPPPCPTSTCCRWNCVRSSPTRGPPKRTETVNSAHTPVRLSMTTFTDCRQRVTQTHLTIYRACVPFCVVAIITRRARPLIRMVSRNRTRPNSIKACRYMSLVASVNSLAMTAAME